MTGTEISVEAFYAECEKIAKTKSRTAQNVRQEGAAYERVGRKAARWGYLGAAGLLGGSFVPAVNKRWFFRAPMRAAALASGMVGYLGEAGMRSGKGYQLAADVHDARKPKPVSDEEFFYQGASPTAFMEARERIQKAEQRMAKSAGSPSVVRMRRTR